MAAIGQHINLAFCKHTSCMVRSCGAGRSPRTDVAHWFVGKSNTSPDFLAADLHFLAVLSKGLISGVNLMFLNKRTNAHAQWGTHFFQQRDEDSWVLFFGCCLFFLDPLGGCEVNVLFLDWKGIFLCKFSAFFSVSWNVIGFIWANNPVSVCQTSSQSGQALKFTTSDSCDRIKDEFQFLQAQYHRCRHTHTHTRTHYLLVNCTFYLSQSCWPSSPGKCKIIGSCSKTLVQTVTHLPKL